jgi:hypothetical protein
LCRLTPGSRGEGSAPVTTASAAPAARPDPAKKSRRDPRIDVMRGLAMFIIFIAHIPGNPWTSYIPARFGPSDATEWFVFCSGFASAIAFGGVFLRAGWGLGIARVLHRVWQIYWAQIGMFLATAGVCVLGTWALNTRDYVEQLNLYNFFDNPQEGLVGLFTLTYVPNLFDILPMYMVALLLIPVMVGLYRLNPLVGLAAPVVLWAANRAIGFDLPAERMVLQPVRLAIDLLHRLRDRAWLDHAAAAEPSVDLARGRLPDRHGADLLRADL